MKIALLVISVIAYIGAPIGLLMLLFKRFRSRGIKLLIGSVVVIPLAGFGYGYLSELEAKQAGFRDASDQSFARLHGFSSAEEWNNNRDRVHAEIREGAEALREEKKRTAEAERQAQERRMAETTAKAKAEELAQKSTNNQKLATKTRGITEDVVAVLRREYSIEPQPSTQNKPFCRDDGYCQLNVGRFRIEIMGAGVVDIQTTSQEPHSRYQEMCTAVFSALTGSSLDFSAETVEAAFTKAGQSGSVKLELGEVELEVKPDGLGLTACSFFKFGD